MRKFKTPPGNKPGTVFPDRWASGPDPELHRRYKVWIQQKNQAQYRGEAWDLPFLTWVDIWGLDFDKKGKTRDCLCMTRIDLDQPWHKDNVKIITRAEHFASNRNKEGKFSRRKNNAI